MKKNYFMLAATTMMFAACAQTDVVNEIATEETPQAIGFETFANKATRAENSSAAYSWNLEDHHSTFMVWGGKKLNDGTFHSVYATTAHGTVTHDGTNWHANPAKYWDKAAAEYDFIAAAPATQPWEAYVETENDFSTGYLTLSNFQLTGTNLSVKHNSSSQLNNWKDDPDVDLLISNNTNVDRSTYNKPNPEVVPLQFNHILSRLNIIVCKHADVTEDVVVTQLVVGQLKSKASFDESSNSANPVSPGTKDRWSDWNADYSITGLTGAINTTPNAYLIQSLVIPQDISTEDIDINGTGTINQAYFKIAYKIGEEPFYGYYNLAKAMGETTFTFGEGWQNTLTITIHPDKIAFSGTVAEWAVVEDGGAIE